MILDNHVQTKIQSAAGSEEWGINHLGMGVVTPYDVGGISILSNGNIYTCVFTTSSVPIAKIILRGNISKTVKIISCRTSFDNEILQDGVLGTVVIRRGTISNIGSWIDNGVKVSLDSSQPNATTQIFAGDNRGPIININSTGADFFNMYTNRNNAGLAGLKFFKEKDFIYNTEARGKALSVGNNVNSGIMFAHVIPDAYVGFLEMSVTWIEY